MDIKNISKISRNEFMTAFFNSLEKVDVKAYEKIKALPGYTVIIDLYEEEIKNWEIYLKLSNVENWTREDRIERILYTINSNNTFTFDFLKEQCKFFTNGEIEVDEKFSEYHFIVRFVSSIGIPPNMSNVEEMIKLNKPAHLTFEIKFRFRTHKELQRFTHKQLQGYTHKQLREMGVIN